MGVWIVMTIVMLLLIEYFSETILLIFICLSISFIIDYSAHKEKEVEKYCGYFPETEICKAVNKNPGYLTSQQKRKMIQRVIEEDERRKDLKKIQDIEVE